VIFLPAIISGQCFFDDNSVIPNSVGGDYSIDESFWEFDKEDGIVEVPYYMEPTTEDAAEIMHEVLRDIEQNVHCVQFKQQQKVPAYYEKHLYIKSIDGECGETAVSGVVYLHNYDYRRELNMNGSTCGNHRSWRMVFVHEMFHVFRVIHTQKRSDRDKYITVIKSNIIHDATDQYEICGNCPTWGPYECNSIMHYDSDTFAWNGRRNFCNQVLYPTMITNDESVCSQHDLDFPTYRPTANDWRMLNEAVGC